MRILGLFTLPLVAVFMAATTHADVWSDAERGFAENGDVKIHYATLGEGPLVIMIHGFPDFWYTWRHQMAGLADEFRVVAIDQRGYNRSSQPDGVENYDMSLLVDDVAAVIRHFGEQKAVVVGHDWGGVVAWNVAFRRPELVDKLIILNLPHPNGLARERAASATVRANTAYAEAFRQGSPSDPDILFGGPMTAQTLAGWVADDAARAHYVEAFERSDFDAMLNYYKRNYPPPPEPGAAPPPAPPRVAVPVLMFHGLEDTALPASALGGTWNWIDADLTLVTVPGASHFVQQDAPELVSSTMRWWLLARE